MDELKITLFKIWADSKFGKAPDPNIPQHLRYQSYFEAFCAGFDISDAIDDFEPSQLPND